MVTASLICENISVFSIFENREKFSTQPKGLFLRNKRKMPRKKIATYDFCVNRQFFVDRFVLVFLLPATSIYKIFPTASFPAMRSPDSSTL